MTLKRRVLTLWSRWRRWSESKHRSGWDRGNRDTLAIMIEADRLRKARHLP